MAVDARPGNFVGETYPLLGGGHCRPSRILASLSHAGIFPSALYVLSVPVLYRGLVLDDYPLGQYVLQDVAHGLVRAHAGAVNPEACVP